MQTAFGNSSAAAFQIHFAPSATTTCRFAAANPNRSAARQSHRANADGSASTSLDAALSIAAVCRAEPASRSGRPVFAFRRSAVWNTATLASRVFDGRPSSPVPASRRATGTPVPSGLQHIVSAGASRNAGSASSHAVISRPTCFEARSARFAVASTPASRPRRAAAFSKLASAARSASPQRRRRSPHAVPPRDAQLLVQNVPPALRAPARPVAAPQRQRAEQRQRRRRARAAPDHRRAASPARRRPGFRVQRRQTLRKPRRRAAKQRAPQVQLELPEPPPAAQNLPAKLPELRRRRQQAENLLPGKAHASLRSSASRANMPSVIAIPFAVVVDTLSVTGNRDDSPNPARSPAH